MEEAATRGLGALLSPAGPRGRLAVFCYHQVLERHDPLRPGEPDAADFAADVEVIARVFSPLALRDAARRLREGTLPARAACITFDDGYENNHARAASILERAGVPATFFISGGALDDGIMWHDLVIEAVARGGNRLELNDLTAPAAGGHSAVASVLQQLKYREMAERMEAARRFYRDNVAGEPPRLMMARAMVADLARRGFEVGGHTLNHPILAKLGDDEARSEIENGSRWIEEVTGKRPATFAYPNGRPETDFGADHVRMVAEAGHETAVTTQWDVASIGTDVYRIPRIGPWWRLQRALPAGFLALYGRSRFQAA
jgi:peptidoglycan/xylan/chitin deacetylase (PgdA/CDA1 family)